MFDEADNHLKRRLVMGDREVKLMEFAALLLIGLSAFALALMILWGATSPY